MTRPDTRKGRKAGFLRIRKNQPTPLHPLTVISERRRLEQELKKSEQFYRTLIENAITGVYLMEPGRFIFVNQRYCELSGYSSEELIALDPLALIAPAHREEITGRLKKRFSGEEPWAEYETRMICKDGSLRDILIRATRVEYDGRPMVLGNFFDISRRKEAERALEEKEKKFRLLYEDAPLGYQSLDDKGRLLEVNKSWLDLLDYPREEVIGHWFGEFLTPESRKLFAARFPCAEGGEAVQGAEFEILRRDGSSRTIAITGRKSLERSGQPNQTHCILQDITNRTQFERQLRQVQKMEAIGTLAGGIAHDFNNLLGAIIGYADMALLEASAGSSLRHDLEQILQAGFRARGLTRQILAFSRQTDQERKPIRIGPIIKETLKLMRASIPSTIEVQALVADEEDLILGDPTQIHQVIMNLCTNAAQTMRDKGGILNVRLAPIEIPRGERYRHPDLSPGPFLKLEVRDTGLGIEPRWLDKIFDPFFTTKEAGEGTGMGLAVVHGIVKSHGGVIGVESEPGRGSRFTVFLPRIKNEVPPEPIDVSLLPTGRERILLIDDEDILVELGKQMLEYLGYQVTGRTSSLEALQLFKNQPDRFDLIITDHTMPQMTGLELSRALLNLRPGIPIILCTGFSETITPEKVQALGIRELVMKPVVFKELAGIIRQTLNTTEIPARPSSVR